MESSNISPKTAKMFAAFQRVSVETTELLVKLRQVIEDSKRGQLTAEPVEPVKQQPPTRNIVQVQLPRTRVGYNRYFHEFVKLEPAATEVIKKLHTGQDCVSVSDPLLATLLEEQGLKVQKVGTEQFNITRPK